MINFSFLKKHLLYKYDTQVIVQSRDFGKLFGGRVGVLNVHYPCLVIVHYVLLH